MSPEKCGDISGHREISENFPWLDTSATAPNCLAVTSTTDKDPDFTDDFCAFLQRCVSNVDAAELLLALARSPEMGLDFTELRATLAPAAISEMDVHRCIDAFRQGGIVTRDADGRLRYFPSPSHDSHVATLARLYIERPVTLFRVIYALRDAKIKTFADAFRLRG